MIKIERIFNILVLLSLPIIWTFFKTCNEDNKNKENQFYPDIRKNNYEYNGRIRKRTMSKVWRNAYLIELHNNEKFSISGFGFLEIGDSISRPYNSDYLFITMGKSPALKLNIKRDF